MCRKTQIQTLTALASDLWHLQRALAEGRDPIKVRSRLDDTIARIPEVLSRVPLSNVVAVNAIQQGFNLSREAQQVIHDNLSEYLDPEVVAGGLLVVARVRLEQAAKALSMGDWGYPLERVANAVRGA